MVLLNLFQLALLLVPLVSALDDCPSSESVVQEVCTFDRSSDSARAFRTETRLRHGVTDKSDKDDTLAPVRLFDLNIRPAKCWSSCSVGLEGVDRRNVTWCIRLADANNYIETCVSLDENDELVFQKSCNDSAFDIENHLSLPTEKGCGFLGLPGCLGFTNLNWFFKDAYLTCISETENCRDVSFSHIFYTNNLLKAPDVNELVPVKVQPSEQIIISAQISSSSSSVFISWTHNNVTYDRHHKENPICDDDRNKVCRSHTVTDRVNSYTVARTGEDCTTVTNIETYLVIDNATESDAGEYELNVVAQFEKPRTSTRTVNISVECDETLIYKATCSNSTIVRNKGDHSSWQCTLNAPHGLNVGIVKSKSIPVEKSDLRGKKNLKDICYSKEPTAVYDVVEEELHPCFSKYTVQVIVCSTSESVVGNYSMIVDEGSVVEGSTVSVKLTASSALSSKSGKGVSPVTYAVPLFCLLVALVGIVIVLVVLIRRRKRKRVLNLRSPDPVTSPVGAVFHKKNSELFSPVSLISPQSASAAFNDPLEFPRNKLYVYTRKVLGEGSFGRVLQAEAEGIVPDMPNRNLVAIKTTKENATSVEIEELLAELDLMKSMKPHENILNLLGQCTTKGGPVCLIVEYARYGNLRDFLRQCEEVVLSLNHKPHFPRSRSRTRTFSSSSFSSTQPLMVRQNSSVFTPGSANHQQFVFPFPSPPSAKMSTSSSSSTADCKSTAHHPNTSVPLAHSVAPIGHDYINSKGMVYMEDVHNFALQIACGLQHLASMEIVHCDLAARNVLIAEGFVLKIADFGLARDISGREMYKKNPRGKIPVKWTAPEALENRIFTIKSDVWSYGVVLWELFTYGHTPYPDLHLGQSYDAIISYLKEGNRMTQPDSCSDSFYELMLKCWSLDPDERPTPIDLVATLTPLDQPCLQESSDLNEVDEKDTKSNGVKENGCHPTNEQ